jgi:hypothetical protein
MGKKNNTNNPILHEDGYDAKADAYVGHIESGHEAEDNEQDQVIKAKLAVLRKAIKDGSIVIRDDSHPDEKVIDFGIARYSAGTGNYELSSILNKSGKQPGKEFSFENLVEELNKKLFNSHPEDINSEFMLNHPVRLIRVSMDNQHTNQIDVIVEGYNGDFHYLQVTDGIITDADITWGNGEYDEDYDPNRPAEHLIGRTLQQEMGKDLADSILALKDYTDIPYPLVPEDAALLNDFYVEQVALLDTENPEIEKLRAETSQYAIEHITRKGMHTGIRWLEDSFNDYFKAISVPGVELPDIVEIHHRQLLAQRVAIDCAYALNKEQQEQLDKVLDGIAKDLNYGQSKGLRL